MILHIGYTEEQAKDIEKKAKAVGLHKIGDNSYTVYRVIEGGLEPVIKGTVFICGISEYVYIAVGNFKTEPVESCKKTKHVVKLECRGNKYELHPETL